METRNYYLTLILFILGLCGYGLYLIIMITNINKNKNPVKYILISAYLILTIHAIIDIYKIATKPGKVDAIKHDYVSDFPANIGYGLICVYFCLIINKPLHPQLLIGLFGYLALMNRMNIGAPLLVISFVYSIYYYASLNQLKVTDTIAKIFLICYFGLYSYIYTLKIDDQREIHKYNGIVQQYIY